MPVKVNVYYNTNAREFIFDYNLMNHNIGVGDKLLLRFVNADQARIFVDFVYSAYPAFKDEKYFLLSINTLVELYDKFFLHKLRIKRINVVDSLDVIIIDRTVGNYIPPGARFFCGHCGESICEVKSLLTFPFTEYQWKENVSDHAYSISVQGVRCHQCNATLFIMQPFFKFVDIYEYFDHQKKKQKQ